MLDKISFIYFKTNRPFRGKKDKKKQQSILEKEIMSIMEKGMKAALDRAIDDLLKDWK